jgi:hypothetical protein
LIVEKNNNNKTKNVQGRKMTMKEKQTNKKTKPTLYTQFFLFSFFFLYVKRNEKEQSTPQTTTKHTQNKK